MNSASIRERVHQIPAQWWVLLVVFGLNLILVSPKLMPTYLEINAFDEAKYIESGRLLLQGEVRNLSWGPIVALIYAPLHLIFGHSPNWFVLEARAGSLLLYSFMWLSTYYLGLKLKPWLNRYVLMGALFVATPLIGIVTNQSDAVFMSFSALALAKILAFRREGKLQEIWLSAAFLSLAILARFEGVLLLPIYFGIILWLRRNRTALHRVLAASLIPIAVISALYLFANWLSTGTFDLGIQGKSYDSFEVNQPLPDGSEDNERQRAMTRELFGTAAENQGSVFRAALSNPAAFIARFLTNLIRTPGRYLVLFGNRLGPSIAIFALLGFASLIYKRQWGILTILVLWSLQPAVSLVFLPLHFLKQLAYLPILIAGIGLQAGGLRRSDRSAIHWAAILLFGFLTLYAAIDAKPAFLVTGIVLLGALTVMKLADTLLGSETQSWTLLLLLAGGLILRPAFEFPNYPPIAQTPHEEVVHYLLETVPENGRILERLPLPAVAAKASEVDAGAIPSDIQTPEALHGWFTDQDIDAIYNPRELNASIELLGLLREGEGLFFQKDFTTDNGNMVVWLVLANSQ